MSKSSAPRNRRQRERERRGMAVGQVAYDANVLSMLIVGGWLSEAQSFDRATINQALTDFIADAATRCAHAGEIER